MVLVCAQADAISLMHASSHRSARAGSACTPLLPWMVCHCFLGWSANSHERGSAQAGSETPERCTGTASSPKAAGQTGASDARLLRALNVLLQATSDTPERGTPLIVDNTRTRSRTRTRTDTRLCKNLLPSESFEYFESQVGMNTEFSPYTKLQSGKVTELLFVNDPSL